MSLDLYVCALLAVILNNVLTTAQLLQYFHHSETLSESNSMFFHHLAPDGAPTFVMATDVTSITITLTWSPPRDDLHNGIIRHYLINILEVNTSAAYTLRTQAHTSLTIGVLHPFYTYELSVQAVTVLPGPASPTITVVTLQDGKHNRHTSTSPEVFLYWFTLILPSHISSSCCS